MKSFMTLVVLSCTLETFKLVSARPNKNGYVYMDDMIYTNEQYDEMYGKPSGLVALGRRDDKYRWPKEDGSVIVPYKFSSEITDEQREVAKGGMKMIEDVSCVKFVKKRSSDENYVKIEPGEGCKVAVGNQRNGAHILHYGDKCLEPHQAAHEFMHVIGFDHMQNHYHRDDYITVLWDDIAKESEKNYKKKTRDEWSMFGTPYDFESVMHYREKMVPKPKYEKYAKIMGRAKELSKGDIKRINLMYECE